MKTPDYFQVAGPCYVFPAFQWDPNQTILPSKLYVLVLICLCLFPLCFAFLNPAHPLDLNLCSISQLCSIFLRLPCAAFVFWWYGGVVGVEARV